MILKLEGLSENKGVYEIIYNVILTTLLTKGICLSV